MVDQETGRPQSAAKRSRELRLIAMWFGIALAHPSLQLEGFEIRLASIMLPY